MRQDQYPPAGPITGNEPITTVQGGQTVNLTPNILVPYMQDQLKAWVMSLGIVSSGDALSDGVAALTDGLNSTLTA